jgi:hypothetical protein
MTIGFDPSTLGFSRTFLNQVAQTGGPKFPSGTLNGGYSSFGAILPSYRTYNSSGLNGSYSKFVGTHTFKMGADYRKIGVDLLNPGSSSGTFQFDKAFTSSTGLNNNSTVEGNSVASFLLAAARDRRQDATHHQHGPVGVEELRPERRQIRTAEIRGDQPLQPRADQQHRRHRRELHVRADHQPVGLHAAVADHVPLQFLGRDHLQS